MRGFESFFSFLYHMITFSRWHKQGVTSMGSLLLGSGGWLGTHWMIP
jgi:hypothetical protein